MALAYEQQERLATQIQHIGGAHLGAILTLQSFTEDALSSLQTHAEYVVREKEILDVVKAKADAKVMGIIRLGDLFTADGMREAFISHRASIVHLYPNLLTEMALIYRIALFDALVPDVIRAVLSFVPQILKTKDKSVTYEELLELHEANSIVDTLIEREVGKVTRQSVEGQAKWIEGKLGIRYIQTEPELATLVEVNARRNILVHNGGVVNAEYLFAVPATALTSGERVAVDREYWESANKLLKFLALNFWMSVSNKFCPDIESISRSHS